MNVPLIIGTDRDEAATFLAADSRRRKLREPELRQRLVPIFMYLLTWESDFLGGLLKSGHSIEIPLVFEIPDDVPLTGSRPRTHELAAMMSEAWIAFAEMETTSVIQAYRKWPSYSANHRATMLFDNPSRIEIAPFREELDFSSTVN